MKLTQGKINELLSESACEHNTRKTVKAKTNPVLNKLNPALLRVVVPLMEL